MLNPFHSVSLTLDGQVAFQLEDQDEIIINDSKRKKIALIKNDERLYFETIKEKFIFHKRN
jgi:NAD kinase